MIRLRLAHFMHVWADRLEGRETYRQRVLRRLGIAASDSVSAAPSASLFF